MPIIVTAEEEILVGRDIVFEDDGDTGYFYALDTQAEENRIQDALWIYNAHAGPPSSSSGNRSSLGHQWNDSVVGLFK